MKMLSLCIDIDGTITEPYYWLPRVNKYFNTNKQPKDVTIYDIHTLLGVTQEEYNQFYSLYGKLLHKEANIRTGAKEVINKLFDEHEIHFVTAREEIMRDVSLEWLDKYQLPRDSINLLGSCNKVFQAFELGCDIFIEDRYENAIQLAEVGFDVLLIDCNYNKGSLPPNVTRVNNWYQIEKFIGNYNEQYNKLKLAL